jgi:hypothetical protein
MHREIARRVLEVLKIRIGDPSDHERFVGELANSIRERCGKPLYPKPGESMALSIMTPKTAALAFDRVYRVPAHVDPVPEGIGFYYATFPEIAFFSLGLVAFAAEESGLGSYFRDKPGEQEAARNEVQSLRLLCSEFQTAFRVAPTIFYHNAASCNDEFPTGAHSILKAAVSNVAMVDEADLSWEQAIEFRRDADVRRKYRRFVRWVDSELKGMPPHEVEDLIAIRIDDYEWALKKHGIKASLGAISCLLDPKFLGATSAAVAAGAVAGGAFWAALAGAVLTVGRAAVSFGTAMVDGLEERRKEHYEIAYVYEVQRRLGA